MIPRSSTPPSQLKLTHFWSNMCVLIKYMAFQGLLEALDGHYFFVGLCDCHLGIRGTDRKCCEWACSLIVSLFVLLPKAANTAGYVFESLVDYDGSISCKR